MSPEHPDTYVESVLSKTYYIILSELNDLEKMVELSDKIIEISEKNPRLYQQIQKESARIVSDPILCDLFKIDYKNPMADGHRIADYVAYLFLQTHGKHD